MSRDAKPQVGTVLAGRHGPVTTTQLVKYAGASGDFNRIHFDQEFAEASGLGGLVAHGMLTMGFAVACLTDALGPDARVEEIAARFVDPVRVGDVVDSAATLVEVRADGRLLFECASSVAGRAVLKGRATIALEARA